MKPLIMQLSPASCHLSPLGQNILLSTLLRNALSFCTFLNVRVQASHQYRTIGKIIVLNIQIFMFLNRRR
jgi:hypothetical protein